MSGEPRGYRVLDVQGEQISHRYRSSAESRSDTIGEIVGRPHRAPSSEDLTLQVNVFDASEQAEVLARVDDAPPAVLHRSSAKRHFANLKPAHHWKLEVAEGRMTTGRHRIQVQVKEPGETAESFDHIIFAS